MTDPSLFWMAALIGLGGFTSWLVKKFIDSLERDRDAWRRAALTSTSTAEKATDAADRTAVTAERLASKE